MSMSTSIACSLFVYMLSSLNSSLALSKGLSISICVLGNYPHLVVAGTGLAFGFLLIFIILEYHRKGLASLTRGSGKELIGSGRAPTKSVEYMGTGSTTLKIK
ncbi:hypothetical protein ACFE04_002102 [Oxalis oulophora]